MDVIKRPKACFWGLFCLIVFNFFPGYSQSPFDDLQAAYDQYSQGKFKVAAASFDKYFGAMIPTAKDHYFAAICNAQAGNKALAIELADKAAYGMESYAMMLADKQFTPIHPEIRLRYVALEKFYLVFNNRENRRNDALGPKIDSLYWSLPVRRLNVFDYSRFVRATKNELKDTVRALQLVHDLIASAKVQSGEIYRVNMEKVLGGIDNYLPSSLGPKIEKIAAEYSFMMNHHPQAVADQDPKIITPFVLHTLYERGTEAPEILTSRHLKEYFQTPEGQALVRYWISMNIVPTILASDQIFPYAIKEYSESQRTVYEYLKSRGFNTAIPRTFDQYRSVAKGEGKQNIVPRFQSNESPANKDWNVLIKIVDQKLVLERHVPEEKLVLLKKNFKGFAENAGDYHKQPAANQDFIRSVKAGKFPYYTIALIQDKHLKPLTTERVLARLKTNIESDDETYLFGLEAKLQWVSEVLPDVITRIPDADRAEALEFIDWYNYAHPTLVDYAVGLMTKPDFYINASDAEKGAIRRMMNDADELLPKIFKDCPAYKADTQMPELYNISDEEVVSRLKQSGAKIAIAWEKFKKESPFELPAFVPSKKTVHNELTEKSNDFVLENGKPVFFDPRDHRVFKGGKTYFPSGETSTAYYNDFVKEANSEKAEGDEEAVSIQAGVLGVPLVDEVTIEIPEQSEKPLIDGASFDGTAYIFTPSHHINSDELLTLKASQDEILKLTQISASLGLNPNEYAGANIYYDRFYAFNAFGKIAVFCHDRDIIFSGFMNEPDVLKRRTKPFHDQAQGICKDKQTSYTERVFCLNRMEVEPIGDRLAVMASVSVSGEPYCSSGQYCRVMVKVLDKDLNILSERMIPGLGEPTVKFNSNSDIKLVVHGDRIFAFVVPECCGPAPMHVMVMDKDLNVITPLHEVAANTGQIAMLIPTLAVTNRGDDLLIAYPVNRNNDILLELRKVSKDGVCSQPAYLEHLQGVVTSNALSSEKNGLVYHYVEREGDLYFYKKLEVPWQVVNKLK